jgi:hypothetical protein
MPADTFGGENGDLPSEEAPPGGQDGLSFTTHDLGRHRPAPTAEKLGFALAPRPVDDPPPDPVISFVEGARETPVPPPEPPEHPQPPQQLQPPLHPQSPSTSPRPPTPADGFVIRESHGVAPMAPVDALVVGAPVVVEELMPVPTARHDPFRITSTTRLAASDPNAEPPWTVREPDPGSLPALSRRGWSTRHSNIPDASAHAAMLRLREEAVHVSWKSAWIAVTAADPRLSRKRNR